jgi:osmotically-inducible protein OsmY
MPAVLHGCSPVGVAVGAAAVAGVALAEERSVEDVATDARISVEYGEALFQAHIDDLFRTVYADVMEGRVLLSGMVRNQELADRAGNIAWQIDGVRKVYNEIQIGDAALIDEGRDRWITAELHGRLLSDGDVYDVNYAITTVAGTIHINGIAQSQRELDIVIAHASDIEYVRRLVTHVVRINDPVRMLDQSE